MPTDAIVTAYEQTLGVDMWRRDITHPDLFIVNKASRTKLLAGVERGDPGILKTQPTAHRTDVSLGNHVSEAGAEWFRKWMVEGETATLRTNSLSVIAKLLGKQNSDLVIEVLESAEDRPQAFQGCDQSTGNRIPLELCTHPEQVGPRPGTIVHSHAGIGMSDRAFHERLPGGRMSTRIADVEIPDTKLVAEATELVREAASPLIFHHSRRVYLFGALRGRNQGLR
jgi:hypothetical protein